MKIKLRVHQHMRPIGGHHYVAHQIRFEGDTLDEVAQKVSDYRLNNSIAIGDPKDEILRYYLASYPFMVDIDEAPDRVNTLDEIKRAWVEWVRSRWSHPQGKTVTPKEAAIRWQVCLGCPHNRPFEAATPEEMEMDRKAFLMRKGHGVPAKLGFCSLHKWVTPIAVFSEAPAAASGKLKETANYPGCWVA